MFNRWDFIKFLTRVLCTLVVSFYVPEVWADPPSRVARLSYVGGEVSFSPAGENDWVAAYVNRPLIAGDRLWTNSGSRTELQFGNASVRLDQNSSADLLTLNNDLAQIQLTQGSLNLRVRRLYDGQIYEINTPTLAFVISRPGEYRIDVNRQGTETTIIVFSGAGIAYGEAGARFQVDEDESVRFYNAMLDDYETLDLPRPDDFDRFCFERDDREDHSRSRRYVAEEIIGYDDLDNHGSWTVVREYGNVWFPSRVRVGWAPYRDGHWTWIEPWGWTWVDDAPWGFAPFHYGRWAYISNRWGWIPGPINVRPVYAPALVVFAGGRDFRLGIGRNPVCWFPLGPREIYVPSYRVSRTYFTNINVSNTTINHVHVTNIYNNYSSGNVNLTQINYANRGINNAITAVSAEVFTNSRPVGRSAVAVDRAMAARAEVSAIARVVPSRASLAPAAMAHSSPPEQVLNRSVIARTAPSSRIAPFSERQAILERNGGRPMESEQAQTLQSKRTAEMANSRVRVVTPSLERTAVNASSSSPRRNPDVITNRSTGAPVDTSAGNRRERPSVEPNPRNSTSTLPSSRPSRVQRENVEPRAVESASSPRRIESIPEKNETSPTSPRSDGRALPSSTYHRSTPTTEVAPENSRRLEPSQRSSRVPDSRPGRTLDSSSSGRAEPSASRSTLPAVTRDRSETPARREPTTEMPKERVGAPESRRPIRESQPATRPERTYEAPSRVPQSESRSERNYSPPARQGAQTPEPRSTPEPRNVPMESPRVQPMERSQPRPVESRSAPPARTESRGNENKRDGSDDNKNPRYERR